jgi:hypothetical protein
MRALLVFVLLLIAVSAAPVSAQDASALVEQGLALRRQGRDAEAAEVFRQAYAADRSARSLAQVALAEQAAGQWVAAERDLVAAMAMSHPWIQEHRGVLDTALATIRQHIGRLTVVSNVAGAELWLDGRAAGTLPLAQPVPVEAGSHVVEVRAAGFVATQRAAVVRAGELARVSVELVAGQGVAGAAGASPGGAALEASSDPSPLLVTGLVGAGLTAVGVGLTIAFAVVREDGVRVWNDDATCPATGPEGRLGSCPGVYSDFRQAEELAIGLGVASAALTVGSAVLLGVGASEGSATVSVSLGPDGGFAALRGQFE